jgi:hypothetical protein
MATNVNYDDKRFGEVEADKQQALTELEQTYAGMIGESDNYYQAQIDASKQWAETQSQLQQENTDFAIQQIEQQKEQAQKDYTKEQSGAYVDWQKQSNQYGVNAERQAAAGMAGTGFSESSQVSMFNTYQNRVATARETVARIMLQYDNDIQAARLQNNTILAEIAANTQQKQLELALQAFQYKNSLILEQANKKVEMDNMYYQRYQDVLAQINHENAMAEEIRQFNQNYELQMKQYNESIRQFNQEYALREKEYKEGIRQFNEEIARLKAKDKKEHELEIKNLELKKKQLEQEQKQWEAEQKLKKQQLEEEKRQFDAQMAYQKSKSSGGSSGGGGSKSSGGGKSTTKVTGGSKQTVSANTGSWRDQPTPTNNMQSIIKLGYGPISASRLAQLINSGQVKRTLKNGQYYYSKNTASTSYNRLKNMGLSK